MTQLKKLVQWVPLGLKELFMAEAGYNDDKVVPIREIIEIDPTHPGLDEDMMAALRGDYDDEFFEDDEPTQEQPAIEAQPKRRFAVIQGGKANGPR